MRLGGKCGDGDRERMEGVTWIKNGGNNLDQNTYMYCGTLSDPPEGSVTTQDLYHSFEFRPFARAVSQLPF